MIRIGTLLWVALAVCAGYATIQFKYGVQALERDLTALDAQILRHQEAIHVLKAEWAYLNEPARLEKLSRRYLDLSPVRGSQIVDLAQLPARGAGDAAPVLPSSHAPGGGGGTVPAKKPERATLTKASLP
jgi:cell division protein FtsL